MKLLIVIFSSICSLLACGYSLWTFSIDPKNSNIQMLLEKELIHIEQLITKPNYVYERYNFKFGEKFKETEFPSSFYAIIDKDIYCYDLKHLTIGLEIKKSGNGIFEPRENMININSYCFPNKEELNSYIEQNKEEINKQKNKLFLENIIEKIVEKAFNILPYVIFFLMVITLLYFPVWTILLIKNHFFKK